MISFYWFFLSADENQLLPHNRPKRTRWDRRPFDDSSENLSIDENQLVPYKKPKRTRWDRRPFDSSSSEDLSLVENSFVAHKNPDQTLWDDRFSDSTGSNQNTLKREYEKFEKILAELERESSCNSVSFDSLSEDRQCAKCTSDTRLDGNYHAPYISMDDEKAVEEVSLIVCL